jgi:hypothetical protein
MPAQKTPAALGQGVKNALICGGGVLVLSALGAAVALIFLEQPIFYSFVIAFAVVCGLVVLAFLGTWLYGWSVSGRVVLDCGPHPTRNQFLLNAGLFLVLGLVNGLDFILSKIDRWAGSNVGVNFVWYRRACDYDFVRALLAHHGKRPASSAGERRLAILESAAMEQDRLLSLGERCHVTGAGKGVLFVVPKGVACSA